MKVKFEKLIFTFILLFTINLCQSQMVLNGQKVKVPKTQIELVLGSKDRIPIKKLRDQNRSLNTCTNVSNFVPNYDSDMPIAAQNAFNYALDILEDIFVSDVNITLDINWEDIPGNAIGTAGSSFWRANFSFFPEFGKWYPEALTNIYNGSQFNSSADIEVNLDSSTNWYFGTNGNPAWNQVDLVTVIIHEVSHGLGFAGTVFSNGTPSSTTIGWSNLPNIFDPFVEDGNGVQTMTLPNNTQTLLDALTSDDLFFNGIYTNGSNGGAPPQLKSDNPYVQGSSYSHLDDGFSNEALRSFIVTGDAIHDLDILGVSMMRDLGWEVCNDSCPAEMTIANNNELEGNQSFQSAFESDGDIESLQNIQGGIDVIYDSKTSVELLIGFEVNANSNFEATIDGCGNN